MCLYPAWPLPQGLYSSFHFPSCQSLPPLFSRTLPLSKCWPLLNACFRSCASSKFTWSRVLARVLHYVCRENAFKSINYFLSKFIFQPLWSSNIKSSPTCIPPPPAGIHWLVRDIESLCPLFRIITSPAGCFCHLTLAVEHSQVEIWGITWRGPMFSWEGRGLYIVFLEGEGRKSGNRFLRYSIKTMF